MEDGLRRERSPALLLLQIYEEAHEEAVFYAPPLDYGEDLKQIDIEFTLSKMEELEAEKQALLNDAEFLSFYNARKQHEYCHDAKEMDDAERQRRLQELHLCEIAIHRVCTAATAIDTKLTKWRLSLQHKAVWDDTTSSSDPVEFWLPKSSRIDYQTHDPALAMEEMEKLQTELVGEVARSEELIATHVCTKVKKDRSRLDLEDGRILLKAANDVILGLEKTSKERRSKTSASSSTEDVKKEV